MEQDQASDDLTFYLRKEVIKWWEQIKGCSQIMSANFGGFHCLYPPPPSGIIIFIDSKLEISNDASQFYSIQDKSWRCLRFSSNFPLAVQRSVELSTWNCWPLWCIFLMPHMPIHFIVVVIIIPLLGCRNVVNILADIIARGRIVGHNDHLQFNQIIYKLKIN